MGKPNPQVARQAKQVGHHRVGHPLEVDPLVNHRVVLAAHRRP